MQYICTDVSSVVMKRFVYLYTDVCTGVGCCFPVEACCVVKHEFMFQTGWHGV